MVTTFIIDIDGVFCPYRTAAKTPPRELVQGKEPFLVSAVQAFNKIYSHYNPSCFIMTSGFNSRFSNPGLYKDFLEEKGILVPKKLIIGDQHDRYNYIKNQVMVNNLRDYLIIDDESYGYYQMLDILEYKRLLVPNRYRCLDEYDVLMVTQNWQL